MRALLEGFAEVSGILRDLRKVLERFLIGWTGLPKGIKGGSVRFWGGEKSSSEEMLGVLRGLGEVLEKCLDVLERSGGGFGVVSRGPGKGLARFFLRRF